jgi:hypothetical protein
MSADYGFRILMGELAGVSYLRLFVERRALRAILAAREADEVLILVEGGMRIELSSHAGGQAVIAARAAARDQIALVLAKAGGSA